MSLVNVSEKQKSKTVADFPLLLQQWHSTKNGDLRPEEIASGSHKDIWWKCKKGPDHEWKTKPMYRTGKGITDCPFCKNKKVSIANSVATNYPEIAKEWHPTKNGKFTPDKAIMKSSKKVWWKCKTNPDHEWEARISDRTGLNKSGCPYCSGRKVLRKESFALIFPEIAKQWHPIKNGDLRPEEISPGSSKKVWWKCERGIDHEWETTVDSRTSGRKCPFCAGKKVSVTNSLATNYPEIAEEWHPTKNGSLTPNDVTTGSGKKVWWKCKSEPDHEWKASVCERTGIKKIGCPFCSHRRLSVTNALATLYPEIAKEWHPTKNGKLTPEKVIAGSHRSVWWMCSSDSKHVWKTKINNRVHNKSRCPFCALGWTVENVRLFVDSLFDYIDTFTPAELYTLFIQNGLYSTHGKSRGFIKSLSTGRFPLNEIKKFIESRPSLVDDFIKESNKKLEEIEAFEEEENIDKITLTKEDLLQDIKKVKELPILSTNKILRSLDSKVIISSDIEAIHFFLSSARAKIWKHAFHNEEEAINQVQNYFGDTYAEKVKKEFLKEYKNAKNLQIPHGYSFKDNRELVEPFLMQRLIASKINTEKKLGNWSGTGSGKTLSAVLASRVINSNLTIICCPNSVVDGWREAILQFYPDSEVKIKTFFPKWSGKHKYLVLNYEMFQQNYSLKRMKELVDSEEIDFVVVDEIQFVKQREPQIISKRKQVISSFISLAEDKNPNLRVLGMSATPVINNLQEGKKLVELITGEVHEDLQTKATVVNCMKLHQKLVNLGIRWMPQYDIRYEQEIIEINCEDYLDEIIKDSKKGSPLTLEQILTKVRLPTIIEHLENKTLIYTEYVTGIVDLLKETIEKEGWKVGVFTGDEKKGLESFIKGDTEVLIASGAIKVGVDGLQAVCNKIIMNCLPWTNSDFVQIKGRIYRQGQVRPNVKMIIPITYAIVNSEKWSYGEYKLQRLKFKKSIADAAVDGVVPEGHLRTPAQAYKDLMGWLERLKEGKIEVTVREKIVIPIPEEEEEEEKQKRYHKYGNFSRMNRRWNQSKSSTTHERLQKDSSEWEDYHALYREARKDWEVVPYEEMIKWFEERDDGYEIGDFGCGEAKIAKALAGKHTIHSFDHIAINEEVIECDMSHVPLEDEILDAAIFSLSLMGTNLEDYLLEAHRILKLDSHLHIIEATTRFSDKGEFLKQLEKIGFTVAFCKDMWKFTHIYAVKTSKEREDTIKVKL